MKNRTKQGSKWQKFHSKMSFVEKDMNILSFWGYSTIFPNFSRFSDFSQFLMNFYDFSIFWISIKNTGILKIKKHVYFHVMMWHGDMISRTCGMKALHHTSPIMGLLVLLIVIIHI